VAEGRPYAELAALTARAEAAADALSDVELTAALARHPRIGERPAAGHDGAFSAPEQSGVEPDGAISACVRAGNLA
jgi:2-oxo-4-hydroxy-4-carboxy-5-ureidoimidazoline decarboxylase